MSILNSLEGTAPRGKQQMLRMETSEWRKVVSWSAPEAGQGSPGLIGGEALGEVNLPLDWADPQKISLEVFCSKIFIFKNLFI